MFFKENFSIKNLMFVLLLLFLIWFIVQIKEIALLFFGAYVIACSLNPLVDKLSKHMNRALASTLVLMGFLLVIIIVFIPIINVTYKEIQAFLIYMPQRVDKAISFLTQTKIMGQPVLELINLENILDNSSQIATDLVNKSINITVAIIETITVILSVSIIVFYLIYEKSSINNSMLRLYPPKLRKKAEHIFEAIEEKVGGYIVAQVLAMATVALFTALGLFLIKVDYAVLLGLIAGVLDIIPILGPTVALILGISIAASKGWIWVVLTIAVYLIAQWISNNLVRPFVFGKFMNMHPVVVIFSFLVAAKFLGVWGVILAPAIAATLLTLFDELYVKPINGEKDTPI